jgi:hypothetical protein
VFCLVWFRASDGMPPEAHGRWMYAGLAAWAAVDLALLAGALARPFGLIV